MEVSIEALIADRDSHREQANSHLEQAEAIENYLRLRGYIEPAPRGKRPFKPRGIRENAPVNKFTHTACQKIPVGRKFTRKQMLAILATHYTDVVRKRLEWTTDTMLGRGYPFKNLSHGLYIRVNGEALE